MTIYYFSKIKSIFICSIGLGILIFSLTGVYQESVFSEIFSIVMGLSLIAVNFIKKLIKIELEPDLNILHFFYGIPIRGVSKERKVLVSDISKIKCEKWQYSYRLNTKGEDILIPAKRKSKKLIDYLIIKTDIELAGNFDFFKSRA